jgi:hypothetical protein
MHKVAYAGLLVALARKRRRRERKFDMGTDFLRKLPIEE